MSLNDSALSDSQPPAPFSLPPSLLFFYLIIIVIVIITLELRELYLGHFNQLRSDLIKGETAGMGGRPCHPTEARAGTHSTRACTHAHRPWDDSRGVREGHTVLLMPQNKEQDQTLQERPKAPPSPSPVVGETFSKAKPQHREPQSSRCRMRGKFADLGE